jgi:hypothetical protein
MNKIRLPGRFYYWKFRMKDRIRAFYWRKRALLLLWLDRCESCGTKHAVKRIHAMTMYYWNGKGEDPNRDLSFCPEHVCEYQEYWQERWDEYNSGRL